MMKKTLSAVPLTREAFEPYGEVIETPGAESFAINNGNCIRHHALATADVSGETATVIVSIFAGQPYALPHTVTMVERHPLGSQAFYPLGTHPWLVIVCDDEDGKPVRPRCFLVSAHQGVNLKKGLWHGVLTPLVEASDFLIVDRGGDGENLEEFHFSVDQQFIVNVDAG